MSDEVQTKAALARVMNECLNHPDKKKDFIREGTLHLLLELCRSKKRLGVKAYAAACLAVLCHQNNPAKTELLEQGGSKTLLSLCRPFEENIDGQSTKMEKLLCHEQSAALLQKLTYENPPCQNDLVNAGIIRHLVKLCDVFTPNGCHSDCCLLASRYSKEARDCLEELTLNKKLIGNVSELNAADIVKKIEGLVQSGAEIHCSGIEIEKIYLVDLYDTTTTKDIKISQELISKGLVWPDLSCVEETSEERQGPSNEQVKGVWSDVTLLQVLDAGHFWAHVGGEVVRKSIGEIQESLQSQELSLLSEVPPPGSLVCTQEIVNGNKMIYRARVLDVSSSAGLTKVKVFAIDFGFTAIVSGDVIYAVPPGLDSHPPQVSLCCLPGIQAAPENPFILEYTAGALRNLCEKNEDFIAYVATSGGIDAILKLCLIPDKRILLQAVGALSNFALDFRYRARIGFLGGIKLLLNLCLQYEQDEDIIMAVVGALQSVLVNSHINRSRALDANGLAIFVHVYCSTTKEEIGNRTLRAIKNLIAKQTGDTAKTGSPDSARKKVDMRSIIDQPSNTQPKFSLSISTDDGYRSHARTYGNDTERCRRRRARRAKGLVEPKPTHVAISVDTLDKQISDISDTDSDSDERYAGRWTSETDGDTDGEMLIKDSKTVTTPSYTQLAETLSSERYYVQTHHMPFIEDETHEFSSQTNVHDISKKKIAKTLCAFLNNKKCGTIYIGVRSNGEVCGVRVRRKERDLLRLGLDEMVERFKPPLKHDMYRIEFVPTARPSGSESPCELSSSNGIIGCVPSLKLLIITFHQRL